MHHRTFQPRTRGAIHQDSRTQIGFRSRPYDGKIAGLYDLEETLGQGHFAVVKLARHVFTGEKVAVKVIDKSKLDEKSKAQLFQEVRCMKLVQHPNVVRLYEVIDTATKLYLVLELGDGGDLYEYIIRHDAGLSEKVAKEYFIQIVRAISFCHQLHVVHRDLKPENVVFFKKLGIVKLTDFGFSNKFCPGQKLETSCGSLAYSAPEILLGYSYDAPAVDVWSLGVILYMLVCGQPPFQEANDSETLTMIMDCKYDIPPHVSKDCQKLISRMLVRDPEKRATLGEISKHPWLCSGKQDTTDSQPLVSKEQLSEEDRNLIIQKIVNGNIATIEEIHECLDKNEYNHITATYYLLAERKLRAKRQEQCNKNKRPEQLSVNQNTLTVKQDSSTIKPCLLTVPRTPGDLPQRSRKCSIVQEDEEEEEDISYSERHDIGPQLNRRGSRSEGRLNLTLQEKLAESERRKPKEKFIIQNEPAKPTKSPYLNVQTKLIKDNVPPTIPIIATEPAQTTKTKKDADTSTYLSEILDDADFFDVSQQSKTLNLPYEQRRSKFNKLRTTSCSSSDASDDDSEKRKKRSQKYNTSSKPFQGRRDSHDDSSDSQEPGTGTGSSVNNNFNNNTVLIHSSRKTESDDIKGQNTSSNNGRKCTNGSNMFGRRHKMGRKRNGSTRLRESQSLNRITEVQEDSSQSVVISATVFSIQGTLAPKVRSISTKIMHGFNKTFKKSPNVKQDEATSHVSRKDTVAPVAEPEKPHSKKDLKINKLDKYDTKKIRMLEKYFHVYKNIHIPLPEFLSKNRLYKAQSCSSLLKDKLILNQESGQKRRAVSVVKCEDDINQNKSGGDHDSPPTKNNLNNVCDGLNGICYIHIDQASKCYSFA